MTFDKAKVREELDRAFAKNSETRLLSILKANSFLFFDLYTRRFGIQPNFCEVQLGSNLRCDFCWLNDNSDGPEWVLVEVEKPNVSLFRKDSKPTAELNSAIEQVKSWDRYFLQHPNEKERLFGAVSRFRYILIVGAKEAWQKPEAASWRAHHNQESNIEIRSMDTFYKSLDQYHEDPRCPGFEKHPSSRKFSELGTYCRDYQYLRDWRTWLCSNA